MGILLLIPSRMLAGSQKFRDMAEALEIICDKASITACEGSIVERALGFRGKTNFLANQLSPEGG